MKEVAFTASPEHLARLALYRKGESDLLYRDGMWFLTATCEVPEAEPNTNITEFLGIDLGIVNIATTSDGQIMAGRRLNRGRLRERTLRQKLQRKNTPSAKRRLKKRRRKEARRVRDINHKIAKHVVAEAERTGRGIALEDLTGIRARVRLRKPGGTSHALKAVGEGHPLLLGVRPARSIHRVQGPQGGGTGGARRSGVHLPHLRRMWPHRQGEPGLPGPFRMPVLRVR
jgi:transposase